MRLLVFHADSFAFETRDRTDGDPTARTGEREDCIAVFVTVEAVDTTATDAVVASACEELVAVADQLRTDSVVLYPSGSLGDDPAGADEAAELLAALDDALAAERDVLRAPVDWHTGFELAARGHPFAEQSRRVTPADSPTAAAGGESEWVVALPDGTTRSPRGFLDDSSDATDGTDPPAQETLRALVERLRGEGSLTEDGQGRSIDDGSAYRTAERESGFIAVAAGTAGGPQFTPRGTFVRDAIAEYARAEAIAAGAVPVEQGTVGVHSPGDDAGGASDSVGRGVRRRPPKPRVHEAVLSTLEWAGQTVGSDPSHVYRTATEAVPADGAQRAEQTVATVPELWSTTADLAAARTELLAQAALVRRVAGALALDTVPVLRVAEAVPSQHDAWIDRLVEALGEPVLVEHRPESPQAWPVTLAFVTAVAGRAVETGSIWLAPGDGETGRGYLAPGAWSDGERTLLCCRPVGGLERATATAGARAATRDPPRLPAWLAPTQVRLVPTDPGAFRGRCHDIADRLDAAGVRVDIDDSQRTVGERLDRADADWIPYDAVVGRPEAAGEPLEVTVRETGAATELTVAELRERVLADVGDQPRKRQYLPRSVRDQPGVGRSE